MSLRDFIRATTKDLQAAGSKKVGRAEPSAAEETAADMSKAVMPGVETEETEDETPLVRKPSRKKRHAEGEREGEKKRRRNERVRREEREVHEPEEEKSPEVKDEVEVGEQMEEPEEPPVDEEDLVWRVPRAVDRDGRAFHASNSGRRGQTLCAKVEHLSEHTAKVAARAGRMGGTSAAPSRKGLVC